MVCDICETRAKATETLTVNKVWHKANAKEPHKSKYKKIKRYTSRRVGFTKYTVIIILSIKKTTMQS